MRVEVRKKDLANATKKLLKTADCRGNIPVLACLLAEIENGKLRLTTTDLEVTGWAEIPVKTQDGEGKFVFPVKKLEKIVSKAKGNSIVLEVKDTEGNRKVIIDTGKTSFSFKEPFPVDEFPEIERDFNSLLEMDAETFLNISKKLLPFASKDEGRYILNFINIEAQKDALHFVATDGHYLAWYKVDWEKPPEEEFQISINRKVIPLLKTFISSSSIVEVGTIEKEEETKVVVKAGDYYLSWKAFEGEYPDWRAVVPEDYPNRATFCRKTLLEAIDEVSVLFEKGSVPAGKLEVFDKELTLSAKEFIDGEEQEAVSKIEIESNVQRDPIVIGFNLNHLSTTLKTFSKETIRMLFDDEANDCVVAPVLFTCSREPELRIVVMPMKVQ